MSRSITALLGCLLLAACGQKGNLYLPDESKPVIVPVQPMASPVPPAATPAPANDPAAGTTDDEQRRRQQQQAAPPANNNVK